MNKRDGSLDILRTIGILTIFLSHTRNTPIAIDYLRNFEVFLLVLVSGTLLCSKDITDKNGKYFLRRVKRIVIPTWFFLTVLFGLLLLVSIIRKTSFPYSIFTVIDSYLMINGIGYVWIMLIYCLIAIGAPILINLMRKHDSTIRKALILVGWSIFYFFIKWIIMTCIGEGICKYYLKNTIPYFFIYSLVSIVPLIEKKLSFKGQLTVFFALLAAHCGICLLSVTNGIGIDIASHKYPPDMFYITYALGMSGMIFIIVRKLYRGPASRFSQFVSKNSQWVYFNHIFAIYAWNEIAFTDKWYIMYFFVFSVALLLTYIQRVILKVVYNGNSKLFISICKQIFG